jgi:hypothetical protein
MTHKDLLALAVAVGLSGGVILAASAQDKPAAPTPAPGAAHVKNCPPASARSAARGMTAQAAPKTATSTGSGSGWTSWFTMGGVGRNPVGRPGMWTGVDTGVTRGPALSATHTTGIYGAGALNAGIVSSQAEDAHGVSSAGTPTATASADPC